MFLDTHYIGYSLSSNDIFSSVITGFSAFPYAQRHWELAQEKPEHGWRHKITSVFLHLPVIGGFFGLVERIVFFVKETFFQDPEISKIWKPHSCSLSKAYEKMTRNLHKAIAEHSVLERRSQLSMNINPLISINPIAYLPLQKVLANFDNVTVEPEPLVIVDFLAKNQGSRPAMEDVYFCQHSSYGTLAAILDGHGGVEVAQYAADQIKEKFFKILEHNGKNVHRTFELLIDHIEKNVRKKTEWEYMGTTALISFIDKKNQIYTATVGDSETNIYRVIDTKLRSIPISCVRNWSSTKDAKRAARSSEDETIAVSWPLQIAAKDLRFPAPGVGLNVSRAIGDEEIKRIGSQPGVTHKPKISICTLQKKDCVILASDGLKDYVLESEIIEVLQENPQNPAIELVKFVLSKRNRDQDNISVIALKIT